MEKIAELFDKREHLVNELAKLNTLKRDCELDMIDELLKNGATDCFSVNWNRVRMHIFNSRKD